MIRPQIGLGSDLAVLEDQKTPDGGSTQIRTIPPPPPSPGPVSVSDEDRFEKERKSLKPVSVSDEDRFEKERKSGPVQNSDSSTQGTQSEPKSSGTAGLPEFNIAGFNGYLVLVVIGMIITAVRYANE